MEPNLGAITYERKAAPAGWIPLEWVDLYNNRRLLEPIGNMPPAEAEAYYAQLEPAAMAV